MLKTGVYIDGENVRLNGGYGMQYDVLREFACRDGAEATRLNAYLAYDVKRAEKDVPYRQRQGGFSFASAGVRLQADPKGSEVVYQ